MKEIVIKTQNQLEKLPKNFKEKTKIIIDSKKEENISLLFHRENSYVFLIGETVINRMQGNSQVNRMWGNSQVNEMQDNSQVNIMRGNSQVNRMQDNSQVNEMWCNSQVNEMQDNSQVNRMQDNSQVNRMQDNSQVNEMWCNSQVNEMWGNSQVNRMQDNSQVTIFETSVVKCYSDETKVTAKHNTIIICFDCKPQIIKDDTVQIVKQKQFKHTKESFIDLYGKDEENLVVLFKSVNPKTNCDFYTGKINYKLGKDIVCDDFDNDINRKCGGGLHLSPKPKMALSYNKGKLLKCKVHIDDFVVYPKDITKVRCKKVYVIEEYKEKKEK